MVWRRIVNPAGLTVSLYRVKKSVVYGIKENGPFCCYFKVEEKQKTCFLFYKQVSLILFIFVNIVQ